MQSAGASGSGLGAPSQSNSAACDPTLLHQINNEIRDAIAEQALAVSADDQDPARGSDGVVGGLVCNIGPIVERDAVMTAG